MESVINSANIKFLLEGLKVTMIIAVVTIILSIVIGTILAVLRRNKGIFGAIAAVYIEIFRNTPLILWILFCRFLIPIKPMYSGILSMTIFTTAVMAEIIRGGLNSVSVGQFEAGKSQGFSTFQILWHIILPQAFRNMVPAILSQVVTTIKDTSFLWVVGIEDLTGKGMILMGSFVSSDQIFTMYGILAVIYFTINFALSHIVRTQQGKLVLMN
jgi:putative glutamine transport system permease protein